MKPDRRFPLTLIAVAAVVALSACTTAASDDQTDSTLGTIQSAEPTTSVEPDSTEAEGASGESTQGSSGSDGSTQDSSGSNGGSSSSPAPSTPSTATPPPAATPKATVTNQKCQNGKLTISLTASIDNSYRKGIKSVLLERQNEYNAWLDYDASWLGPETGHGDVWQGQLVGNQQNIGKTLRVTVTSTSRSVLTFTTPITASC